MTPLHTAVVTLALVTARAIGVPQRSRASWVMLTLPQSIDPGADQRYDNLRIVDDRGSEIPYAVDPECTEQRSREAVVSDTGFVSGQYTQALIDAGTGGELYDTIGIETPRETFFTRVEVALSDDRKTWREVRTNALIYRVSESGDPGSQSVSIPQARARWIRLRILERRAPFPVSGAIVTGAQPLAQAPQMPLRSSMRDLRHVNGVTSMTIDLGTENTQTAFMWFSTSTPEFSRNVRISAYEGDEWRSIAEGTIQRFAQGAPTLEVSTNIVLPRKVRVEIDDGNDTPLEDLDVRVYGPLRRLVFVAQPRRTYELKTIPGANAPRYDLPALLEHDNPRRFLQASPTETESTSRAPVYQPKPIVLTVAFAIAIIVMGAVALLMLRPPKPQA